MAAPSAPYQRIVGDLYSEFRSCIEEHDRPCEVFMAPSVVRWSDDDRTEIQPDIQIRCLSGDSGDGDPKAEAVLVAEVLSPSTAINDCTIKLRKYMTAGRKEYWIVDLERERIMVYLFDDSPLPETYTFDDTVPVGISGGSCSIDFRNIKERLAGASRLFGDSW